MKAKRFCENAIHGFFLLMGLVTVGCVLLISVYLVVSGIPAIREIGLVKFLFGPVWNSNAAEPQFGILPFILTSIYGTAGAILLGVPVGFMTAVFLAKMAPPKLKTAVSAAVSLLAGIPSVVYGLVGMLVLVPGIRQVFHIPDGSGLLAAIIVPLFNVLAVITLTAFRGERLPAGRLIKMVATNPLILGSAVGLVFLGTGWRLPTALESAVHQVAAMTSPFMLFLLGAFFRFSGLRRYRRDLIEVCLVRLFLMPALLLTAAFLIGIRGVGFAGLISVFASATAIASFTMTQQMGGDAELAGDIVVSTSALCIVTMFAWSVLFKALGAF